MDDKKNPLEIPDNNPPKEQKPIMSREKREELKRKKQMKVVKIAYAFAILLAVGGALTAKVATEKALGNLNTPIESDYVTIIPTDAPEETDFEVRQNLQDVPDTREDTEPESTETTEATTIESSPFAQPYKDYFCLPLDTKIINEYNPSKPMYNETLGEWRTHPAIDFKGAEGAQIKAISYGVVNNIYDDSMYGTIIEIDHGNKVTARYCGFNKDSLEIEKGDTVKEGQLLGYLGVIPCEKEQSHLHFEILYQGKRVDPLELMGK